MAVQTHPQIVAGRDTLLRRAMQGDAVVTGLFGLATVAGAGLLAGWLAVPATALIAIGAALAGWGLFIWAAAARPVISRRIAWASVVLGAIWVIDSALLLVTGWLPFSPEGWWLMVTQALVTAGFTEAQYIGLRRLGRG
jgi:hypothetical protein